MMETIKDIIELKIKKKFYELPEAPTDFMLSDIVYTVDKDREVYITYIKYRKRSVQ